MPTVQQYYPPVSDLIDASAIPGELESLEDFLQQGIEVLLRKIYYKDLVVDISNAGDTRLYSLTLVTKSLKLPLIAEMNLVFFRGETNLAEFPIMLQWRWPLLKYVRRFEVQGFSYAPEAFVDILIELADIRSREEFFSRIANVFLNDGDTAYLDFFNRIISRVQTYNTAEPGVNTEIQNIVTGIQAIRNEVDSRLTTTNLFTLYEIYEGYANHPVLSNAVAAIEQSLKVLDTTYNIQINIFGDAVVALLQRFSNIDEKFNRLLKLFRDWLKDIEMDDIKSFLLPQFSLELKNINLALEFPRKWLIPVYTGVEPVSGLNINDPLPEPYQSYLQFTVGSVQYSTASGFQFENQSAFTFRRSMIGKTGIIIEIINLKVDLSRTHNIAEADADNRLPQFVGVYAEEASIFFPAFWNPDPSGSTAVVKAKKLLIGTGGISGIITLESANPNGTALFRFGDAGNTGKHFQVGLTQFLVEFKQNAIVQSDIRGYMKIPGFKDTTGAIAQIDIWAHIGTNGDLRITASENDGILWRVDNAFDLIIKSVSIGRENDKWYLEASGSILITANIPGVAGDFLKQPIEIKKIRIWQDGSIEFSGGGITLPTQMHLKVGPVSLALDHITLGSHEGIYQNQNRQYFYFGFNGALNLGPGGVEVRGDGVEFHFTRDGLEFHSYLRIAGIGIDIKIPGNASEENADILIKGYLAMRNGNDQQGNPQLAGPEYQGAVSINIRPLRIAAKASMLIRPKVPAWIVDVELDLSTPLPLGPTGLGIYGFRGLVGSHYVASKQFIGLSETDPWYEYLKKKVPPRNKQGIGIEKFDPGRKGFSLGVGASIATMGDDGWAFSSKVFVMISMPEMLLVEGQANALHKRLGIDSENDPPFYAFLVIDKNSVQAGIGVNYKLPDNGKILAMRGEMQLGFFFSNSSAWYINVGKDLPEDKRVQARLFTLFNAYAYLMLSSKGIRAGAGARFELQKRFGPVRLGLYAYIDTKGVISFKPIQIGGAIALGGGVYIRVGRFRIELHVSAGLSAEAPRPFVISGFVQIRIKILFVKIKIKLEFTWIFVRELSTEEVMLLDPLDFQGLPAGSAQYPFKAINMLSGEAFTLKYIGTGLSGNPETDSTWNNHVIPMDCYIDFEFKRPIKPYYGRYGGGVNPLPQFTEFVSPQKARMPQVKHVLAVEKIDIMIWDRTAQDWKLYDMWTALSRAFQEAGLTVNTDNFNYGYWQYNNVPGKYTSLRLMAQSPFAVSNGVPPENFGLHSSSILCQGQQEIKTCQYWNTVTPSKVYPADTILRDRKLLLRFTQREGTIGTFPNVYGIKPSLKIYADNQVEIFFNIPMAQVNLRLSCLNGANIRYFIKKFTEENTLSGLPGYEYDQVHEASYHWRDLMHDINFESPDQPISKVVIEAPRCAEDVNAALTEYWQIMYEFWLHAEGLEPWQLEQIALWLKEFIDGGGPDMAAVNMICNVAMELLENPDINNAERDKLFGWGYHCLHRVDETVWIELCQDFSEILASYETYPILYAYAFEWQEKYCQENPGVSSFDVCSLYVHEVCWMTEVQWEQNILLQQNNQTVINVGLNTLAQAINQALPPIWRPDSYYGIVVRTIDSMTVPGTNTSTNYEQKFAIGFKTSSTLGFYHKDRPEYLQLATANKADQYKLAGLLHYIDYQRSYPNADSKLTGAKPLYYKNPKMGLFFTKPYVYEFFTKWDSYQGNPTREYRLQSVIRDPVDKPGDPPVIPPEIIGWQLRMGAQAIPVDALDVETISNILTFGNTQCISNVTTVLLPATVNAEIQRTDVKPQKLYTAIFKAIEINTAGNQESIVHTYNFETSRYGNFAEHIGSYIRLATNPDTGQQAATNAFFPLVLDKNATDINTITTKLPLIVAGTLPVTDPLIAGFATVYDRIISGLLQLTALQAATGTEVNVIKIRNTGNGAITILGLLVRSPEPFNDPKLPAIEMARTLRVTDTANVNAQFTHVFSVDNASIFITNAALSLPLSNLNLAFSFIKFNGVIYAAAESVNVAVNLNTI